MSRTFFLRMLCVSILLLAITVIGQAQATRTWVSGVGDDVNPCSRTAPCKTFAGAISKTATNGEINCLDPGGFGAVTITKSITLDCTGTQGSILGSGTTGIIINITNAADLAKTVRIRGLNITGAATGINGVRVIEASKVSIENTLIDGFTLSGIHIETTNPSQVSVINSTIRNNASIGINNQSVGVSDTVISGCTITGNGTGVSSTRASSIWISNNVITFNTVGLGYGVRLGRIVSFQNNFIESNGTNGTPTATTTLQ